MGLDDVVNIGDKESVSGGDEGDSSVDVELVIDCDTESSMVPLQSRHYESISSRYDRDGHLDDPIIKESNTLAMVF